MDALDAERSVPNWHKRYATLVYATLKRFVVAVALRLWLFSKWHKVAYWHSRSAFFWGFTQGEAAASSETLA
ncbi:MAG: hypothetical protein D0433_06130 [Candidatus Thermochlorobacter aerophilum]|jgi:hypothetical protein|uniref:Uncharacterized protein n=1 Tax=Candidatus Thermochlorobacter aerophilus TaxID=1868324 RepID=A0A395M1B4_9BACT|nr:MAG: hypothetical protein D0433_06130 [Candidatus Thermochlorobacter aerophilum]